VRVAKSVANLYGSVTVVTVVTCFVALCYWNPLLSRIERPFVSGMHHEMAPSDTVCGMP
jgi:hypothetical protein